MKIIRRQIIDNNGCLRNTSVRDIEIDFSNLHDLRELEKRLKSSICNLLSETIGTKKEIKRKKYDSCQTIYETNINDLYDDISLDTEQKYYVYAHCEPRNIAIGKDGITTWAATQGLDLIPFYIGKGTADRAYDTNRNGTHRKVKQRLKEFNKDIQVRIIKDNLTELEALCLESKIIDIFGLIGKGGRLVNLDEGVKSAERHSRYVDSLVNINEYYKNSLKVEV